MPQRNKDPLAYMLAVMNDPNANSGRRDKMAIAAAPYCHPRADRKGKKAKAAELARKAGKHTEWGRDLAYPGDGKQPQ